MTSLEVGFVTADAAALVRFYTEGLGFAVHVAFDFPQGSVHRLRRDEAQCKIFQPISGAETRPTPEPWHRYRATGYAALHVADAEAEVARAVAAGALVLTPVTAHRPDARFALLADPDGNIWEILQESGG